MKKKEITMKQLSSALRELGRLGGEASAKALTPAERTARARKAGKARQAKAKARKGGAK